MVGLSSRRLLLYSSASTTKISPSPNTELVLIDLTTPPTIIVGSNSESFNIEPIIDVVVVFPCVPEIATVEVFNFASCEIIFALE